MPTSPNSHFFHIKTTQQENRRVDTLVDTVVLLLTYSTQVANDKLGFQQALTSAIKAQTKTEKTTSSQNQNKTDYTKPERIAELIVHSTAVITNTGSERQRLAFVDKIAQLLNIHKLMPLEQSPAIRAGAKLTLKYFRDLRTGTIQNQMSMTQAPAPG